MPLRREISQIESAPISRLEQGQLLTDRVYQTLKEAILSLKLPPGEALVEAALAQRLGTSKTPVREALRQLEADGLVVVEQYRGARIRKPTAKSVRDGYELRWLLEPLVVRKVGPRLTAQDLADLRRLLSEAEGALAANDMVEFSRASHLFHSTLAEKEENDLLQSVLRNLADIMRWVSIMAWVQGDTRSMDHSEHLVILDELERGAFERAAELMAEHLRRSGEKIVHDLTQAEQQGQ